MSGISPESQAHVVIDIRGVIPDPAEMNKGGGAAAAALHMIALSRRFTGRRTGVGFLATGLGLSGEGQA